MRAGEEREALAGFADRLCAEFGYPVAGGGPGGRARPLPDEAQTRLFGGLLSREQETLVTTARRSLDQIAAALETTSSKPVPETTYRSLIDGAELVMRGELLAGNSLLDLMPSFVFLISLLLVEQEEALELSNRTSALLGEAAG